MSRWNLFSTITGETYDFEINPNSGGSPQHRRSIQQIQPTARDGQTIMFESRPELPTMSFSGVLISSDQFNAMELWFQRREPIWLTDDLGRQFIVYLTSWAPDRVYSSTYPWRHNFSCEATVLQRLS